MKMFIQSFTLAEPHDARTLPVDCVGNNKSGWTVQAAIHEDHYQWVNYFEASHPKYGSVLGDFESVVSATSEEAYEHFVEHHPFEDWDYWDI